MKKKKGAEPFSVWSEDELMDGERARCLTIILTTSGCSWWKRSGGCSMCGYNSKASDRSTTSDDVKRQFERAWEYFDGHGLVKIYTSGSFLDECEIPLDARDEILSKVGKSGARLLFESRPEFVTEEKMRNCLDIAPDIELALGLESANDSILTNSIMKGFSFADYEAAARHAKSAGAAIRTYLLLKPPYLTEGEAIDDVLRSVDKIKEISKIISINPVNVQRKTRVERMWKSWAYRPPWLWSIIDVFSRSKSGTQTIISSTVAAGSERGPHNCGKCDTKVIQAIESFNLSQERNMFDGLECNCIDRWKTLLYSEEFSMTTADHERFFSR